MSKTITVELREEGQQISLFESVGDRARRRRKKSRAVPVTEAREWPRRLLGERPLRERLERVRWVVRLLH
jgi:hypothetical protein